MDSEKMNPQRRASDHRPLDIENMIAEENDPRQRAFLIVLNSINNNLNANTKTTTEVAEKLDAHLTNYEQHTMDEAALINKGIGAWKVIAWILGLAQSALAAGFVFGANELNGIHHDIQAGQIVDARAAEEMKAISARVNELRAAVATP
jgi:hypothetical protein